ncbi:MAG: hypothetical protein AAFN11_03790 [Chloroflexota bacterium]
MTEYVALVGLEENEAEAIRARITQPVVSHVILPSVMVKDGDLYIESNGRPPYVKVSKLVFHGIYDDDLDFISALNLWQTCRPA